MELEEKKVETAYHESGHAVIGYLHSFHIRKITIIPERNKDGSIKRWGHVDWEEHFDPFEIDCATSEKVISKFYSGDITDNLFLGNTGINFKTALQTGDLKMARNYDPCYGPGETGLDPYIRIFSYTKIIIQNSWTVIETLVQNLLKTPTIPGKETHSIIETAIREDKG